jgi:hypothetical protein
VPCSDVTTQLSVIELRRYTLLPGKRDELIRLFEAELVNPQEACGMRILGTFRDFDDQRKFVWLRGFPSMEDRARSLQQFYSGPVWRRHRDAANATMIDSDDVLLLRPAWRHAASALELDRRRFDPAIGCTNAVVQIGILSFGDQISPDEIAHFRNVLSPAIRQLGGSLKACLVTEFSKNNFPALPIREGENVLVWYANYASTIICLRTESVRTRLDNALLGLPGLTAPPELLRLEPTARSRITGCLALVRTQIGADPRSASS